MLRVARQRPGGHLVQWVEGDAGALEPDSCDLLLMTGHVAQVFVDDGAWAGVLAAARRALCGGGRLAFDSRDPRARAWEGWTRHASYGRDEDPVLGPFDGWFELREARDGVVRFDGVTRFARDGEELR